MGAGNLLEGDIPRGWGGILKLSPARPGWMLQPEILEILANYPLPQPPPAMSRGWAGTATPTRGSSDNSFLETVLELSP